MHFWMRKDGFSILGTYGDEYNTGAVVLLNKRLVGWVFASGRSSVIAHRSTLLSASSHPLYEVDAAATKRRPPHA